MGPILGIRVADGGKYDKSRLLHAVRRISGKRAEGVRHAKREKRAGELASIMRARRRANGGRTFRLRRQVLMEVQRRE